MNETTKNNKKTSEKQEPKNQRSRLSGIAKLHKSPPKTERFQRQHHSFLLSKLSVARSHARQRTCRAYTLLIPASYTHEPQPTHANTFYEDPPEHQTTNTLPHGTTTRMQLPNVAEEMIILNRDPNALLIKK